MQIELVQYAHEDKPHAFEAQVSLQETQSDKASYGRVHVGRVKVFDEETGKYSWFCLEVKKNGNNQPVLEVTNIRPNQDKIVNVAGRWRQPETTVV